YRAGRIGVGDDAAGIVSDETTCGVPDGAGQAAGIDCAGGVVVQHDGLEIGSGLSEPGEPADIRGAVYRYIGMGIDDETLIQADQPANGLISCDRGPARAGQVEGACGVDEWI